MSPQPRGYFITLEGGEGSGKSTVARALADRLREAGRAVTLTEEPAGTALGRHLWGYFRDKSQPPVTPLAELFLFQAARAQHVQEVLRPALAAGDILVCDRFADSSVAYQGYGRGLGAEMVDRLNEAATGGLSPDLTLLLDLPVQDGLARARARSGEDDDAIGQERLAFHERVREGFLAIASANGDRVQVLDAARPLAEVIEAAWERICGRLPAAGHS